MTTYLTSYGDLVDDIVFRAYGDTSRRIVETVLAVNRGLAGYGPVLPAGISISLPERAPVPAVAMVKLYE